MVESEMFPKCYLSGLDDSLECAHDALTSFGNPNADSSLRAISYSEPLPCMSGLCYFM